MTEHERKFKEAIMRERESNKSEMDKLADSLIEFLFSDNGDDTRHMLLHIALHDTYHRLGNALDNFAPEKVFKMSETDQAAFGAVTDAYISALNELHKHLDDMDDDSSEEE